MNSGDLPPEADRHDESRSVSHSKPPRVWPVFVAVLASVLAAIGFQIVVVGALAAREMARGVGSAELADRLTRLAAHPGAFILLAAGGELAFALAAIIPARLSPVPTRERLGLVALHRPWTIYPVAVIGSIVPLGVGVAAAGLLARVLPPDSTVRLLFEQMTPLWSAPFVLFIALAPGFCEEMFFRGYVQRRLLQRWRGWTAITVTSLIFGLAHVTPHGILVALPLGFWFGVLAWRTGSIGPGIACHAFVNGGVNLWRVVVKFGEVPERGQWIVGAVALASGLVCFVAACRRLALTRQEGWRR